jgi:lysozyme
LSKSNFLILGAKVLKEYLIIISYLYFNKTLPLPKTNTMTQQEIKHKPTRRQAALWLFLLLVIPFFYLFKHQIVKLWNSKMQCEEPRRREWKHFEIPFPPGYAVHGIDVSDYSCKIDWNEVKKMNSNGVKVRFAFMRATRGTNEIDLQFTENWEGAKEAKILRGAYHFYKYSHDPISQAHYFLKNVKIETGDLPAVLDIEDDKKTNDSDLPKADIIKGISAWLAIVEQKTGIKPIIYTNLDYYKRYIAYNFPNYKIWIANYNNMRGVKLPDGKTWSIWQIGDKARCNGISEKIDFNIFNGSMEDLKAFCKQ